MKKKSASQSAFFNVRVLIGLFVVLAGVFLALLGFGAFSNALAQAKGVKQDPKLEQELKAEQQKESGLRAISPYHSDVSRPLRDAPTVWPPVGKGEPHEANPNPMLPRRHVDGADPVIQKKSFFQKYVQPAIPGPILNFDGIPFPGVACNCAPPDTNGAVGKNHYVQIVNEGYQVFDKITGTSVLGPNSIVSVWSGFGGACQTGGFGDPVVMYDKLADRWVITEFASGTGGAPITDECVAVSATGDPTGSYYRYGYHLGSNFFDYPKLAVWPDAYYMSMNVFNSAGTAFLGVQPFAFDRSKMLVGDPTATVVTTGFAPLGASEEFFLPADLDGIIAPPAGAPNPYVEWPGAGTYRVYLFHADFVTPANSTFTLLAQPAAAAFTQLCPGNRACVPEPNADHIDAIADRLMHRSAYRKFPDGHDALVDNYTVSANAVAGVRWFEMRNPLVAPVVFQESTYQPDTTWRFMGSVAQDNQGNMALGFTVSSATVFPGLSYAGRLAGDPVNTLAQGEAVLFTGLGSQSGTNNRWGDYSAMTVDPVDDCTFWYTNEYYPAGSATFNWRTRIGNFKFTQCTAPAKGTGHFVVTVCDGGSALDSALVSIDGNLYGSSAGGGLYDATLAPGNHTYSVSKPPIYGTVSGNFTITDGQTTNVPVCLVGTPLINPAGTTLTAEGCSPPNGVIDPNETVSLDFKVMNNGGASTTNLVATLQAGGGVTNPSGPQNYGAVPVGGMVARSFTFTAANAACGAPIVATFQLQDGATNLGNITYNLTTGVLLGSTENFDGVTAPALPAGWVATNVQGAAPLWVTSTGSPSSAPNSAFIDDPASVSDKVLETPPVSISGTSAQVSFQNNYGLESTFDGGVLEVSSPNINGGTYTDITDPAVGGSFVSGGYNATISTAFGSPIGGRQAWSGSSGGYITSVANLGPNVSGQTIKLRFRMASDTSVSSTGWNIDDVLISSGYACCGVQIAAVPPAVVTAENGFPADNAPDPGETLTVNLSLHNVGTTNTTNLVATLQPTGGVTNPSGPQSYGVVVGLGAPVARPFTFTASGTCGNSITLTLALQDGANNLGTVTYTMTLGSTMNVTSSFSNPALVTIPASGTGTSTGAPADPYPSAIVVSGLTGTVSKVTVGLNNLNHTFPGDVDMLLVAPGGQSLTPMSDVIGGTDWVNISYVLDDAGATLIPASGTPVSGTFKPTNYGTGDLFPAPAPGEPYGYAATAGSSTFASVFNGTNPNGTWNLWIVDDAAVDVGTMGGWTLNITTAQPICAMPVSAVSRKTHGAAGDFDIPLPLAGTPGIECRSGGGTSDYQIIVTFPASITVTGSPQAQVTSGTGMVGSGGVGNGGAVTTSGNMVTIPLTSVANAQTIYVTLNGVSDGTNMSNMVIPMSRLVGDTNGNGTVSSADVSQTKSRIGQSVVAGNFRSDVNANGSISSADTAQVKSSLGTALP